MKKYLSVLLLAAMATGLTSCLKDGKVNLPPGGSPSVIEFSTNLFVSPASDAHSPISLYAKSFALSPSASFDVNLAYTGGGVAPQDIVVNLSNDTTGILGNYNDYSGEDFKPLPAVQFSMPTTVTIKKGEQFAKLTITVKPDQFDLTAAYAIPLKIASVSAGTISGNYGKILVSVGAINKYDGIYSDNGYVLRAGDDVLSGFFKNQTISMVTAGPNSVTFAPLWADGSGVGGIGGTTASVNPTTNKVTMFATGNPALTNDPSYDNRYDPATKTFYLSYYWGTGIGNRAHRDTLVFKSAR